MTDKPNPLEQKLTEIRMEHTFTVTHAFILRDTLARRLVANTRGVMTLEVARALAEGLMADTLVNLTELNRLALAADATHHEDADAYRCDDSECTERARTVHEHGPECSHLCRCGKGRM